MICIGSVDHLVPSERYGRFEAPSFFPVNSIESYILDNLPSTTEFTPIALSESTAIVDAESSSPFPSIDHLNGSTFDTPTESSSVSTETSTNFESTIDPLIFLFRFNFYMRTALTNLFYVVIASSVLYGLSCINYETRGKLWMSRLTFVSSAFDGIKSKC